jgi:hypothetical protein
LYKNRQENDDTTPTSKTKVTGKEFSLKLPIIILFVIRRGGGWAKACAAKERGASGMVNGAATYPEGEMGA